MDNSWNERERQGRLQSQLLALRSGGAAETRLNEVASSVENVNAKINIALEAYPELKAHAEIADAMQQNSYLQRTSVQNRMHNHHSI